MKDSIEEWGVEIANYIIENRIEKRRVYALRPSLYWFDAVQQGAQ